jgi:hypothetical protein
VAGSGVVVGNNPSVPVDAEAGTGWVRDIEVTILALVFIVALILVYMIH